MEKTAIPAVRKMMEERFGHDVQISLATLENDAPAVRIVDGFYENGGFYVITDACSSKMRQISANPVVAICGEWFTARGVGENLGYIRAPQNSEIMIKLRNAFSAWYNNGHIDENDSHTILLCIRLTEGVLWYHGTRYNVNFHLLSENEPESPSAESAE